MPKLKNKHNNKKTSYYEKSLEKPELLQFLKGKEKKKKSNGIKLILKWKAYKRIIGYSYRYANNRLSETKWREVYGILIGSIDDNKEIIKDAVPMVVGDRAGVQYESKQYVDMAQIDASTHERAIRDKKNDFIIGWWHTHPGFGFFFSPIDCLTQLGYQIPNSRAIGLVFDHTKKKEKNLGIAAIQLREPDKGIRSAYDIVELDYELKIEEMEEKSNKIIEKIKQNMEEIEGRLSYCKNVIGQKAITKLQERFGLIPAFDDDFAKINEEDKPYIWDDLSETKEAKFPEFRQEIENQIKTNTEVLKKLKAKEEMEEFNKQQEKFKKKILKQLEEPKKFIEAILEDFKDQLKVVFPYYDYLDTSERKLLEFIDQKIHQYHDILDMLESKAQFEIED
ncbi:MAG: Mov34/MPN/PAD-1 family protein [Promethearchaeati archaeon]